MDAPTTAKPTTTLLIVEDDILPAMALRDAFRDASFNVLDLTGLRQEALAIARERLPDLALVNIELEGRDDGIALAADLKAMGVPVLLISGQVSRAKSERTTALGSLPKPYSPAEMVEAVHYLLGHLAGDESLRRPARLQIFDRTDENFAPSPEPVA